MKFFGRQDEIRTLQQQLELCEKRKCARMVVITGRRRVGKTTLVLKALEDSKVPFAYCFVPRITSEAQLSAQVIDTLSEQLVIKYLPALLSFRRRGPWCSSLMSAR